MKADILREKFLFFFKSKKHKIIESDSLVPKDDPTVLFTPAGMSQFKKQFLGYLTGYSRAASSQRCLRTDDLNKVGKTAVHHTFFEMLGNFSFGDYFKEEAISWAWEFLTKELKINPQKLWVSVYKDDNEAFMVWKDTINVPAEKIIKLGDKDNFWPAEAKQNGPNGPCGPCSEIFFDLGQDTGCGKDSCGPACDCGRFAEIWNLVFTQYDRKDGGTLEPLPHKNIDTGMGLERLAAVMQGVTNNFETDLFKPIVNEIVSGVGRQVSDNEKGSVYAVADHIRAVVFSIFDGVMPSNESRGYVIRKIIRKSILHLRSLGIKKPFLYKLVASVAEVMKKPYPELIKRRENVSQIILKEEKDFIAILESSDELIKKGLSELVGSTENKKFSDEDIEKTSVFAFQLYDTYGIPWQLTKDWFDVHSIPVSEEVFKRELEKQKLRSKAQSAMKGDVFSLKDLHLKAKATKFIGYSKFESTGKILKIIKDSRPVKKIKAGEEAKLILDKTVFYPESGGQVADTGEIKKGKNIFKVSDTKRIENVIVHTGKLVSGALKEADQVKAGIDIERRMDIARNHTATHLLQAALRKVLGVHVRQQGSLVAAERLRFDFTHFKGLSRQETEKIEEYVNDMVLENHPLKKEEMTYAAAKKTGALAFFGEKYGEDVRVVSVPEVSKEFCGGTHLDTTGQVGLFKIVQEGSVASGIRRIEAVTGRSAYRLMRQEENVLREASEALNAPLDKIMNEISKRAARIKELEKQVSSKKIESVSSSIGDMIGEAKDLKGTKILTHIYEDMEMDLLRRTVDL
ncbi:MAG: alanine--tRNA ligase, partial [Candidatus Omnitrophica bacterium]|nr:alanine--tRNA ligase [Candidatus Omnitrophota bacterium]